MALTERTAFMLRLALNHAEAMGERAIAALGVTGRQYGVLAMLHQGSTPTQRHLGATLGFDRTTTMKLMATLEQRGLVDRSPDPADRRSYILSLTTAGEDLRVRTAAVLKDCDDAFTDQLSSAEKATLRGLLRRLQ